MLSFIHSINKSVDEPVPPKFVKVVKASLAKLVGAGYLDVDHIDLDFWTWFPRKWNNTKSYLNGPKSVILIFFYSYFIIMIILLHYLFLCRKEKRKKTLPCNRFP